MDIKPDPTVSDATTAQLALMHMLLDVLALTELITPSILELAQQIDAPELTGKRSWLRHLQHAYYTPDLYPDAIRTARKEIRTYYNVA